MVEPEWEASLTEMGALHIKRLVPMQQDSAIGTEAADPITLEIFNNLFMSVAEQMGSTLENVSHSVNIKVRLSLACEDPRAMSVEILPTVCTMAGTPRLFLRIVRRSRTAYRERSAHSCPPGEHG